jgi:hypothetical protein
MSTRWEESIAWTGLVAVDAPEAVGDDHSVAPRHQTHPPSPSHQPHPPKTYCPTRRCHLHHGRCNVSWLPLLRGRIAVRKTEASTAAPSRWYRSGKVFRCHEAGRGFARDARTGVQVDGTQARVAAIRDVQRAVVLGRSDAVWPRELGYMVCTVQEPARAAACYCSHRACTQSIEPARSTQHRGSELGFSAWTAAGASPPRLQRCTPREGYG